MPCLFLDETPVIFAKDLEPKNYTNTFKHKKEKKLWQGEKTAVILEECKLRVEKQKMSIEHEKK